MAAACLSAAASGPSSILALPTARCLPTTPSSSRNQAGAAPTRPRTPTADWEPSRCTSQASSQARARVGLELWGSLRRVSPECIPAQRTCPAAWTVLLHPGIRVSDLRTEHTLTLLPSVIQIFQFERTGWWLSSPSALRCERMFRDC